MTLKQFKHLVKTGQIKYFYISGKTASASSGQIGKILQWIKKNGTKVTANKYGGITSSTTSSLSKNTNPKNGTKKMGGAPNSLGNQAPGGQGQPGGMNKQGMQPIALV